MTQCQVTMLDYLGRSIAFYVMLCDFILEYSSP